MQAPAARLVRILIVDDHTLFRRGLSALLGRESQFQVVGDAADAGEAQRRAAELQPDLILLDNHLPGVNGVDALPALREAAPNARVLMLTVSEDESDLAAALRNGASGYLLKTMEGDALSSALQRVMRGEYVVAQEMTGKLVAAYQSAAAAPATARSTVSSLSPPPSPHTSPQSLPPSSLPAPPRSDEATPAAAISPLSSLSPRELDILRGIGAGDSNKEIARKLAIAETTVKIHVQHILRKLDVPTRVHAAVLAAEHGLL